MYTLDALVVVMVSEIVDNVLMQYSPGSIKTHLG